MHNETNVLTEPDSDRKFSETELEEMVKSLALKLEALKELYPHFKGYTPNDAMFRSNLIWYKHNIQYEANPNYSLELEAWKNIRPIKRPLPPQEVAIYHEKDGIEIYLEFTEYDRYKSSQRMWLPDHWIGNYAVELKVKGADTKEIKNIKRKINEYILGIKNEFEK
jgi:hypothetical protein